MDAANVIFHEAKRRVYIWDEARTRPPLPVGEQEYADDEEALRQAEKPQAQAQAQGPQLGDPSAGPIPPEVEPMLEENPKWQLLQEVLDEVEQEIHFTVDVPGKSLRPVLGSPFSDSTDIHLCLLFRRCRGRKHDPHYVWI